VPLPAFDLSRARAVLTGAASGMGEQMAHQLAARGASLLLVDRDEERLVTVAREIESRHPAATLHTMVVDLSDPAAPDAVAARVAEVLPEANLLLNNAGVAMGGAFEDLSAEEFDWVMRVNFDAPVALCRALLPTLRRTPGSHIVNVSSLYGLIGPPGQSAYSSSKYALRGFSEVLRHELAPDGIGVTTVHPGGIRTRIADSARVAASVDPTVVESRRRAMNRLLTFPADKAAAQILAGVERRRARVLIAWTAVVPDLLARVLPSSYFSVLTRVSGSLASTSGRRRPRVDA